MADGAVIIGTYDPYPLTVHGAVMVGIYGTPAEIGTLPTYNPSLITSVARVYQNLPFPQFVIAGQGGENEDEFVLSKKSTEQLFTLWRSPVYQIGKDFDVLEITFNMVGDFDPTVNIIPKLYFDNERSNAIGTIINTGNYPSNSKLIKLTSKNFSNSTHGQHNFFLELQFTGSKLEAIALPIFIEIDEYDN